VAKDSAVLRKIAGFRLIGAPTLINRKQGIIGKEEGQQRFPAPIDDLVVVAQAIERAILLYSAERSMQQNRSALPVAANTKCPVYIFCAGGIAVT